MATLAALDTVVTRIRVHEGQGSVFIRLRRRDIYTIATTEPAGGVVLRGCMNYYSRETGA